MGSKGGAIFVHLLMLSPLAKGESRALNARLDLLACCCCCRWCALLCLAMASMDEPQCRLELKLEPERKSLECERESALKRRLQLQANRLGPSQLALVDWCVVGAVVVVFGGRQKMAMPKWQKSMGQIGDTSGQPVALSEGNQTRKSGGE